MIEGQECTVHIEGVGCIGDVCSISITTVGNQWVFPDDGFTEYEPSDELWARPLGFGCEEQVHTTLAIPRAVATDCCGGTTTFTAIPDMQQYRLSIPENIE